VEKGRLLRSDAKLLQQNRERGAGWRRRLAGLLSRPARAAVRRPGEEVRLAVGTENGGGGGGE